MKSNQGHHVFFRRTVVVGAGYIAVEMAAILHHLGSDVTMLIRKEKSSHMKTRSNNQTTFKSGQHDKFTNGSFMQRTAEIWNQAPKGVKEATELPQAKRAIRTFVKTLPL